jgi:hypothetical protein
MFLGFLLGILLTLIVAVFCSPFLPEIPFSKGIQSNLSTIQAFGSLAVGASAIVAFTVFRSNVNRQKDEDTRKVSQKYLDESKLLLERAYTILTQSGEAKNPPRSDRLLWLSTSRMLIRYNKMKSLITQKEHIAIADEHEEYWRLQFYSLLGQNKDNFTTAYFMPSGDPYEGDAISRNSIAVIFSFSRWRKDQNDPMDGIDDKKLFANGAIPIDFYGVEEYIRQYKSYWKEVQAIKEKKSS